MIQEPSVPLPDFAPEGRSARVVASPSARTNAGRTLDIVAGRLDALRDGTWHALGEYDGLHSWTSDCGDDELDLTVALRTTADRLLGADGPASIIIGMIDFDAIEVETDQRHAHMLMRSGAVGMIAWSVAACRLALAHARAGQTAGWRPRPTLVHELRSLHPEEIRYDRGSITAVHPSAMSQPAFLCAVELEAFARSKRRGSGEAAAFLPPRPCRIIARSRAGAAGVNANAPYSVKLLTPRSHVELPAMDAMEILRLHKESSRTSKGRRT